MQGLSRSDQRTLRTAVIEQVLRAVWLSLHTVFVPAIVVDEWCLARKSFLLIIVNIGHHHHNLYQWHRTCSKERADTWSIAPECTVHALIPKTRPLQVLGTDMKKHFNILSRFQVGMPLSVHNVWLGAALGLSFKPCIILANSILPIRHALLLALI